MSASNLPVLYQNSLMQYSSPVAQKAWLWFAENHDGSPMKFGADRFANEANLFVGLGAPLLRSGLEQHGCHDEEVLDDLTRFILVRHANWRLGGNVNLAGYLA